MGLYARIAIADIALALSRFVLVILLVVLPHFGLGGVLASFAGSIFIGCVILFPFKATYGKFKMSDFKKIVKFSWPLGVEGVVGFFDIKIYSLLIAGYLGPVYLGLFEVANRIPEHLQRVFEAFRAVFFPQISELFSKGKFDEINNFVYHAVRIIGLAVSFLALLAGLFQKEIISILFSQQYGNVSSIFFYLMAILYVTYITSQKI